MRKIILTLTAIFTCATVHAETETIHWYAENGAAYATTTCESGGDIILPQTPYKYGYTFQGWKRRTKQLEYLQKDPSYPYALYFNTGLTANYNMKFRVKFSTSTADKIFGSINNNQTYSSFIYSNAIYFRASGDVIIPFSPDTIYDLEMGPMYIKNYETDSVLTGSKKNIDINGQSTIGININSTTYKLYLFQIYENDIKIRDFVPALDSSGKACMYERIQGKFYYPNGSIIAGPIIDE